MIRVVAKMFINPQDKQKFLESAKDLIIGSRKESGCHFYDLMQLEKEAGVLCFIEEWESHEALSAHNKTPHYIAGIEALKKLWAKEPQVEIFEEIR